MSDGLAFAIFILGLFAAALALLAVICLGIVKPINEVGCNANVSRLDSPKVVDGDYSVWADKCYLTLEDGAVVPFDDYRVVEEAEVLR